MIKTVLGFLLMLEVVVLLVVVAALYLQRNTPRWWYRYG